MPAAIVPASGAGSAITSILFDGENVYWTTSGGDLLALPVTQDGGTVVTLASGEKNPTRLATDSVNLYWTNAGPSNAAQGSVRMRPANLTTSLPVTVAGKQASPFGIAVVQGESGLTTVYWTNRGLEQSDGTVNSITQLAP